VENNIERKGMPRRKEEERDLDQVGTGDQFSHLVWEAV